MNFLCSRIEETNVCCSMYSVDALSYRNSSRLRHTYFLVQCLLPKVIFSMYVSSYINTIYRKIIVWILCMWFMHEYVHVCGSLRRPEVNSWLYFLYCSAHCFLRQSLQWTWSSLTWLEAGWPVTAKVLQVFNSQHWGYRHTPSHPAGGIWT